MRRGSRRSLRFAALGLAFALVAAGCGGDDGDDNGNDNGSTPEETGTPTPGGTLTYAIEAESSGGYCLAEAQLAAGGIQVVQAVYDPLMSFDENLEPKPYLAESFTPNDDFTSFEIKLRSGIKFHDGTDLTAQVVKDNLDLARGDAEALAKYGRRPLLFPFVFSNIDTITAPDPLTVVITTKIPWPAFGDYLAGGRNGIMATAQYSDPNCAENMIGTGPFKLDSWERGQSMELSKNENYWRTDDEGNQLPYLDKLIFRPIVGTPDRYDALDGGTIDAMHFSLPSVMDQVEADDRFILIREPDGHKEVAYGLINVSNPPMDDIEIRRHMAMAIDRDVLNDIANDGQANIANGPFDSEVLGYLEDPGMIEYDPDTANDFFSGKNISVRVSYATDPTTKAIAEEVKSQLEAVGVSVSIDDKDQATLISQALSGEFNIILWRNHPGADPDTQYVWWHSGSPVNFGRINDADIDKALEEGRVELDPERRKEIYEDLNRAFAEGAYNMWNWYSPWAVAASDRVHNLVGTTLPDGSTGSGLHWGWHMLTEVWVDQ